MASLSSPGKPPFVLANQQDRLIWRAIWGHCPMPDSTAYSPTCPLKRNEPKLSRPPLRPDERDT